MRKLHQGFLLTAILLSVVSSVFAQTTESNMQKRDFDGREVQSERDEQVALFNWYFREQNISYTTKFSDMKTEASVAKWRIPYSAAIHPQTQGGLSSGAGARVGPFGRSIEGNAGKGALSRYDAAFNGGQQVDPEEGLTLRERRIRARDRDAVDRSGSANTYERRRVMGGTDRALFARARMRRENEGWEGYCSGFTSSSIRHPEPIRAVDAGTVGGRAGVVFQPEDIKALLTCIYNRTTDDSYLVLAPDSAQDGGPNMGTFHLSLTNYIGRGGMPIGIDRTKGRTSWNNPIYSYKVNSVKDAGKRGETTYKRLNTTIVYSFYGSDGQRQTDSEGNRVNNAKQSMNIDYTIALDKEGNIIGGKAHSNAGHFLWIPLYACQATHDQKSPGNPYIDVRKVVALARASAMPSIQKKYDATVIGDRVDPVFKKLREAAEESENADDSVVTSDN